jgi:DNA-binding transcriptional ArsR family regulator
MGGHDDFGIEKLRVDPALMRRVLGQQARNSKRKGWQRICTVLPRAWELRLLEAKRVSTYRLAIELLYLHWYGKGKPVTVSSMVAKAAKLSGRSKSRALAELERLGLLEIERSPRKSPRVVLCRVSQVDMGQIGPPTWDRAGP